MLLSKYGPEYQYELPHPTRFVARALIFFNQTLYRALV